MIPTLFRGFVDDAAVFPPGSASLPDAVRAHLDHRVRWYRELVGPLLVKTSQLTELPALLDRHWDGDGEFRIGVVADTGIGAVTKAVAALPAGVRVAQIEAPVAKRGEDPMPGAAELKATVGEWGEALVYGEIPLTFGLHEALDTFVGTVITPKFRTGGLLAELFPTPDELAVVIVACVERDMRLKLTAGLHHAARHTDRATGFTHHGFLNVLLACVRAAEGADAATVAEALRHTDPRPLVDVTYELRDRERPLWAGFGSCSVTEPLDDLIGLGLIEEPVQP
ncbi:hypothetical protein [Phytomonospora endophytica]|uniref:Uncharacterized protein n=1 Tax=Phytomonospora endophytica TaxID=714109 RepID=A0A841FVY7_9ACTN|nr:hypothetical protein [Phytomonospora endophytica]MBB6037487.1 hypothetical protein [Phytomonospora endophytica]GIG70738.1 hypothetical protein Pen01_70330 [Phytomonospora endophytica]